MSKSWPGLIDKSQAAYVIDRQVHNNLNVVNYCIKKATEMQTDIAIMSLDAKKAFDSLNHTYMFTILNAYGFPREFINIVKLLYNKLTTKITITGFFSNEIKINQSVKQGDALSCGLFILCIDPLIRKLNKEIKNPIKGSNDSKLDSTIGYADDVAVITIPKEDVFGNFFEIYEKFSRTSGLHLNAKKTEIFSNVDFSQEIEVYKKRY